MCDNKHIALGLIRVLEAGALVFVLDVIDQSVEAANDILRGSGRRGMNVSMGMTTPQQLSTRSWMQGLAPEDSDK